MRPIHPLHAVLLAATVPLFLGALLSDIAYGRSEQVQWNNFASWLIVGGMVFCGCALLWAFIGLLRRHGRTGQALLFLGLLFATFIIGFVDALVHAKDAWAIMPEGPILSFIVTVLAIAATWVGFSSLRAGGAE
ncbi:DUF2231 domain-containing protein [Sphingomonas sp. Leaf67]|uniref:DUF2231 domain-containing protein n=1 Tax=Sphingomonas sp. Leaf67 TaxID=1736230 RepID=UPI002AA29CCC|nr:DUF2231 domain-containing protein [Sphingomonas sp. Leaf67]